MPRQCKTCSRADVEAINELISRKCSLRKIMDNFVGLSQGGLQRHKDNCIREVFQQNIEKRRDGLLAAVDEVRDEIAVLRTEFADNPNVRIGLVGKMLDAIEKEARLTGAYTKEGENPKTAADIARKVYDNMIAKGIDSTRAKDYIVREYDVKVEDVLQ